MKANATRGGDHEGGDHEGGDHEGGEPDLPFVDGTQVSAAELRAQVEALDDDSVAQVEELRAEVAETVEELAKRVDVPAQWHARREQAATMIRQGARDGTRSPAALALAVVGVLVLVAAVRRLRRS